MPNAINAPTTAPITATIPSAMIPSNIIGAVPINPMIPAPHKNRINTINPITTPINIVCPLLFMMKLLALT